MVVLGGVGLLVDSILCTPQSKSMARNKATSGANINGGQGMVFLEAVCINVRGSETLNPNGGNSPTAMASSIRDRVANTLTPK